MFLRPSWYLLNLPLDFTGGRTLCPLTNASRYSSTSGPEVATPQLYYALPTLFALEIVGNFYNVLWVYTVGATTQ